jgi:hypothetical protein
MSAKAAKQVRRSKPPKRKRIQLGLIVSAAVKARLIEASALSGKTQSQEAEALIERALTTEAMFKAMNTTDEKLAESVFQKYGYTPVHSPYGKIWLPKDHPMKRGPGFLSNDDAEAFIKGEDKNHDDRG